MEPDNLSSKIKRLLDDLGAGTAVVEQPQGFAAAHLNNFEERRRHLSNTVNAALSPGWLKRQIAETRREQAQQEELRAAQETLQLTLARVAGPSPEVLAKQAVSKPTVTPPVVPQPAKPRNAPRSPVTPREVVPAASVRRNP